MGVELAAAAGLALLGGGLNYVNQRNVAKSQDREAAAQIRQQSRRQDEADRAVTDLLAQRAVSDGASERGSISQQYLQQARAAQAAATRGLGQSGAVSDAYRTAANDAALGVSDYGQTAATLMGRIDAPQQRRTREALEEGDLQTRLGLIGRQSQADDFLSRLRLQSVQQNPWLSAAAQAANGAASGIAMNGLPDFGRTARLSNQANNITQANTASLFARLQGGG
jgi:hypothetical protein